MTKSADEIEGIRGRQAAMELMLSQLLWFWARELPQPQIALGRWMRAVDATLAEVLADPETSRTAKDEARATIRGFQQQLEQALHEEAVRRAGGRGEAPN